MNNIRTTLFLFIMTACLVACTSKEANNTATASKIEPIKEEQPVAKDTSVKDEFPVLEMTELSKKYLREVPDREKSEIILVDDTRYSKKTSKKRRSGWSDTYYQGTWSMIEDTLVLKPTMIKMYDGKVIKCRPQDDSKQIIACYTFKYYMKEDSIFLMSLRSKKLKPTPYKKVK